MHSMSYLSTSSTTYIFIGQKYIAVRICFSKEKGKAFTAKYYKESRNEFYTIRGTKSNKPNRNENKTHQQKCSNDLH